MPRGATGSWTFPSNSANPAVNGTIIDTSDFNDLVDDIQDGLNERIAMILASDYALTDQNTAQKAFNGSSNGALDVDAATTYLFKALYLITNTGTNSHTWATLFGGTATLTSIAYGVRGRSGTTTAATLTADKSAYTTSAAALVATDASTSATEHVILALNGIIRVNASGTLIPQVKLSATTGGTLAMLANSHIVLWPIGSNTVAAVGDWS